MDCVSTTDGRNVRVMKSSKRFEKQIAWMMWIALEVFAMQAWCAASPTAAANFAFNACVENLEGRLRQQHRGTRDFLAAASPEALRRLREGELIVEQLTPGGLDTSGAMLHHWRGMAFVPGARAEDFERVMRDFTAYPQRYAPQVVRARVLSHNGDHYAALLRVRQHHVLTVVMDTTYDVAFGRLDAWHGYSASRSTRSAEIEGAGTTHERELRADEEHGFLWRLNSYWSYAEADGGLYMQIESVSLTRDIPRGLGWIVSPFVQSIPRESLEFTLSATRNALREEAAREGKKQ
jgi:hypothetical protein